MLFQSIKYFSIDITIMKRKIRVRNLPKLLTTWQFSWLVVIIFIRVLDTEIFNQSIKQYDNIMGGNFNSALSANYVITVGSI